MFPNKLVSAVAIAGAAAFIVSVLPSFAQETPQQPSSRVVPQSPVKRPAAPVRPPTRIDPETNSRSVTVKCRNGVSYKLTTGSNEGACKLVVDDGEISGAFCTDGTNSAMQTCATGCKESTGSGGCARQDRSAGDDADSGVE